MAAVRAQTCDTIMDLDHTMRDESILDSGDDSDVMDNIVFRRPGMRSIPFIDEIGITFLWISY